MPTNRDGRYDSGRPDTAVSTNSEFAESQQQSRPRALLCCGFGHISKPRKSGYKQLIKRCVSQAQFVMCTIVICWLSSPEKNLQCNLFNSI